MTIILSAKLKQLFFRKQLIWFILSQCLFLVTINVQAKEGVNIDSLKAALDTASTDSTRLTLNYQIADYYRTQDLGQALYYGQQSLELAEEQSNNERKAKVYNLLGTVHFLKGKYVDATNYFIKALYLYEEEGKTFEAISQKNNLGLVYERRGEFQEALKYFVEIVEGVEALPEKQKNTVLSSVYLNLGSCFDGLDKLNDALKYYEKVLKLTDAKNFITNKAKALNNIGNIYLKKEEEDKAYSYFKRSLKAKEGLGTDYSVLNSLMSLSKYCIDNNKFEEAKEYLDQALEIGHHLNSPSFLKQIHELYYRFYKRQGKFEEALSQLEKLLVYADEVAKSESEEKIKNLVSDYQQEKEKREKEIRQQEERNRLYATIGLLVMVCLAAGLLYVIQRSKTKQAKMKEHQAMLKKEKLELQNDNLSKELELREKDLEMRDRELTSNVMNLVQKNELINAVSQKLADMKANLKKENQQAVRQIIYDLQTSKSDDLWDEFELRFQNVHNDFYKRLNDQFPDLTPNERKLCAFLRLNMSTKDIASVTRQSIRSIEMGRFRLRKKLGINNSESNLNTFIEQI
ncbi:tetratricopeptide repeat protein [Limibacter armeniacum]|uniref:tetratricopeptide repeat protein n=1 Tax=Limibacter armeniacum TaxID=466084 RepID=UPI002FE58D82